jgi:hypothetical protein
LAQVGGLFASSFESTRESLRERHRGLNCPVAIVHISSLRVRAKKLLDVFDEAIAVSIGN